MTVDDLVKKMWFLPMITPKNGQKPHFSHIFHILATFQAHYPNLLYYRSKRARTVSGEQGKVLYMWLRKSASWKSENQIPPNDNRFNHKNITNSSNFLSNTLKYIR